MQYDIENYLGGLEYGDFKTYERKIDSQPGIFGRGVNFNRDCMFASSYWLKPINPYPSGDTYVLIVSNYPWSNETRNLIESIHIEWIKKI
jgi:hypothetical protein